MKKLSLVLLALLPVGIEAGRNFWQGAQDKTDEVNEEKFSDAAIEARRELEEVMPSRRLR